MKKLLIIFLLVASNSWATSWKIDDTYTVSLTINYMGAATDADSAPAYRVHEDTTDTALLSGTMTKLDDANTTGYYKVQLTLSAANGFEKGKSYNIIKCASVNSITGCEKESFQIEAEVDANTVSGTPPDSAGIAGIQADTDNLQTRIPASLIGGKMDSDMTAISGDSVASDNLESEHDGTGYIGSGIAVTVTSVSGSLPYAITITETGIITVDNQFAEGNKKLYCAKEERIIVATDDNTADTITVEPGNPFNTVPTGTCYIK